ncbi:MAG TPA: DUF1761 domain-containing protein [Candidatus Saccharimonadales bacterium]
MEVAVNWWGVILATLSTMVVGSIWYTPKVFGNKWMKLIGKSEKELGKNGMWPMVITLIVSFISAYVLAHVSFLSNQFFHNSFMQDALTTAFWLWLGFVAARMLTHDAFEGRPWQLTLMNLSHELVTLLVMALFIGWLHP